MNENRYSVKDEKPCKENTSNGNVIIYGFLQKRSKYIHLWKTRFFILTNNYLFAFTGIENDADCTMALDLLSILEVTDVESNSETKKTFVIRTVNANYFFRAEKEAISNKWKNEINKIVEKNRKNKNNKQ